MLDLMRTRTGADPTTEGCAKLLAAIISDAIECASSTPREEEKKRRMNINWDSCDAARSVWFLFDDASPFRAYAHLIGVDAQDIRRALLDPHKKYPPKSGFSESKAHNVRTRYRWYKLLKNMAGDVTAVMADTVVRERKDEPKPRKDDKQYDPLISVWDFAQRKTQPTEEQNGIQP